MLYQRVNLASVTVDGPAGSLPLELVGLDDATLADLPAALDPVPEAFAGAGYWPVELSDPTYDPATEILTDGITNRSAVNSRKVVTAKRAKRARTSDEIEAYRAELRQYAADVRWQAETGGITIAGIPVLTDRSSQAMISGAVALCDKVPSTVIRFKAASGFVDLDAATMTSIAVAVGQHVQGVFSIEATVSAGIEGGSITTRAQIDSAFAA